MTIIKQNHTLYLTDLRELSAANAQSLRDQACAVVTSDLTTIEIDLSETTFVDSFGLGMIASLYKTATERSKNGPPVMRLLYPQPSVQQVFELTRMHHLFEIVLRNGHSPVKAMQTTVPLPADAALPLPPPLTSGINPVVAAS